MIIKSYRKSDVELIMTKAQDGSFSVIKIIKGMEPYCNPYRDYEEADEVYDYLLDMFQENDK